MFLISDDLANSLHMRLQELEAILEDEGQEAGAVLENAREPKKSHC